MSCCPGNQCCPANTQWPADGFVDDDGPRYDIVLATDPFAFVPSLRTNTNVIHDEQPSYTEEFGLDAGDFGTADAFRQAMTSRVQQAVTAFLRDAGTPVSTWEAFVMLAQHDGTDTDAAVERDATQQALKHEPAREWYLENPHAHTLAPALARAIWYALRDELDANGRRTACVPHDPPRLDAGARNDHGWNRTWITVVLDENNTIRQVRNAPDFSTARAVVGLDARPTPWLWQRNVHPDLTVDPVLNPDEARLWRRFERGQTVVKVDEHDRVPGPGGEFFNENHARELVEAIRDKFGDDFRTVGTAANFESRLRDVLREVGVPKDELASMHYGEEKSRDDFAEELVGLVYGCIDPGDGYVLDWLAECNLNARPELGECQQCNGDNCPSEPDCHDGQRRAGGRGFVGPDADHARELLESVRGTHVAQMVGRFGRDLADDEHNVTFVATDTVPDDLVDFRAPGVTWLPTELQRTIGEELSHQSWTTTRELAAATDCTKEHVRQTLVRLEDRDLATRRRTAAAHGADLWTSDRDLDVTASLGHVGLGTRSTANVGVKDYDKWSLAVSTLPHATGNGESTVPGKAVLSPEEGATVHNTPPPD